MAIGVLAGVLQGIEVFKQEVERVERARPKPRDKPALTNRGSSPVTLCGSEFDLRSLR